MPLRVLVTGFEPFHGAPRNPSGDAARALDGLCLGAADARAAEVAGAVLPVLWELSPRALGERIRAVRPHVVICLGMASGMYRVERYADDAERPLEDNAGRLPRAPRAAPTARLPTRLPVACVEAAIAAAGGAVEPSEDAGGFLCNAVFFALMRTYYERGVDPPLLRAGFIHVPSDRHVPDATAQAAVNAAITGAIRATLADLTDDEHGGAEAQGRDQSG